MNFVLETFVESLFPSSQFVNSLNSLSTVACIHSIIQNFILKVELPGHVVRAGKDRCMTNFLQWGPWTKETENGPQMCGETTF